MQQGKITRLNAVLTVVQQIFALHLTLRLILRRSQH